MSIEKLNDRRSERAYWSQRCPASPSAPVRESQNFEYVHTVSITAVTVSESLPVGPAGHMDPVIIRDPRICMEWDSRNGFNGKMLFSTVLVDVLLLDTCTPQNVSKKI